MTPLAVNLLDSMSLLTAAGSLAVLLVLSFETGLLIGFALVYSEIHYPGDIAGSAAISALAVLAVRAALHITPLRPRVRVRPDA